MDSINLTKIPRAPPVSVDATCSQLIRHLRRYAAVVHGDGSDRLTPEEIQAQKDAGVPDDVIQKIYTPRLDPKERESRMHVIQDLVLQDLRVLIREIDEVKGNSNYPQRVLGWAGLLFSGLVISEIRKPFRIFRKARYAFRAIRAKFAQFIERPSLEPFFSLIRKVMGKLFKASPFYWILATLAGYYIFRDVQRLIAIDDVKRSLRRIQGDVKVFDEFDESDVRVLTGWKWKSVPWKDYMREQSRINYGPVEAS